MVKDALDKDELDKMIMGKDNYKIPNRLIEYPVDVGILFGHYFNEYIKASGDKLFDSKLSKALKKLLKDPEGLWWVMSLLNTYEFYYDKNLLLFRLDINDLVPFINESLKRNKELLMNNKSYVGYMYEDGLWTITKDHIDRLNTEVLVKENTKLIY